MSPTAARKLGAQITFTPGTVNKPARGPRGERCARDQPLDRRDFAIEELDVAHRGLNRLGLLDWQLEL